LKYQKKALPLSRAKARARATAELAAQHVELMAKNQDLRFAARRFPPLRRAQVHFTEIRNMVTCSLLPMKF
jgi:hypothetical protein